LLKKGTRSPRIDLPVCNSGSRRKKMGDEGLELHDETLGNSRGNGQNSQSSAAPNGAVSVFDNSGPTGLASDDQNPHAAELARVIEAWPRLSDDDRAEILEIVRNSIG